MTSYKQHLRTFNENYNWHKCQYNILWILFTLIVHTDLQEHTEVVILI